MTSMQLKESQIKTNIMNKYEVVAEMGFNSHMLRVVEAESEKLAKKIMWEQHMDDSQKNNCADLEVFLIE